MLEGRRPRLHVPVRLGRARAEKLIQALESAAKEGSEGMNRPAADKETWQFARFERGTRYYEFRL